MRGLSLVLLVAGCGSSGGTFFPPPDAATQDDDAAMQQQPPDLAMQQQPQDMAGPPAPTCSVTVTPQMGTLADTYTATLTSSNAATCGYQVDANPPVAVPCNGSIMGSGQQFGGVGKHMATVTANGPGGGTTCTASWSITAQNAPPTCTITVTPKNGTVNDTYTATLTSMNATNCTQAIDNLQPMPIPCSGTIMGNAQTFGGVGNHTVVIGLTGPGGNGSCSTSWTIN